MDFNGWDWYWLLWFSLGFGIPEAAALYKAIKYQEYGGTLSENVREWFATDVKGWSDKTAGAKFRRLALFLPMCWLFVHWFVPNSF